MSTIIKNSINYLKFQLYHLSFCFLLKKLILISDVLLWTPAYGQAKAGRPARTYIQQLCEDTGCSPEDLPEATNDREKWRERVRDIRASGTTWWWWWWCKHLHFISYLSLLFVCLLVSLQFSCLCTENLNLSKIFYMRSYLGFI